jgi:hypothetical protein
VHQERSGKYLRQFDHEDVGADADTSRNSAKLLLPRYVLEARLFARSGSARRG